MSTTQTKTKSIDDHTQKKLTLARTQSISIPCTKSNFRSQHKDQVKLDPLHKNKISSTPLLKPSQFQRLHTANNSISIRTLKQSIFRHPHKNQVTFDLNTEVKSISISSLKSSFLMPRRQNQVHLDPYTAIRSSSILHINQINFDSNTRTKSLSTPTQKQSQFQFPPEKQVNLDSHIKSI